MIHRGEAKLRRQEQDMKSTLNSVYKETTHLLRAINRYKDNLASLIEKEGKHFLAVKSVLCQNQ